MKTHLSWPPLDCSRIQLYFLPIYRGRILKPLFQKLRLSLSSTTLLCELCRYLHVNFTTSVTHFLLPALFMVLLSSKEWGRSWSSNNLPYIQGIFSHLCATKLLRWYLTIWPDPGCKRTYMLMQINVNFFFVLAAPLYLSGYLCHS